MMDPWIEFYALFRAESKGDLDIFGIFYLELGFLGLKSICIDSPNLMRVLENWIDGTAKDIEQATAALPVRPNYDNTKVTRN